MNSSNDYDKMADWAESDTVFDAQTAVTLNGDAAGEVGRAVLGGRPNLGSESAGQGVSPRRQVRLPRDLDAKLDAYMQEHGISASEVIRRALSDFLRAV